MSKDQESRARRFRELHTSGHFVIANCWDAGSARVLASLGFPALATSSSAAAAVFGRLDHDLSIEQSLANARLICEATDLPVSADLEKGFGDQPADTARAITRAAEVGLVGGSIEDASGARDQPIYDLNFAIERVAAAVEAARALPFPFTLTARCENHLHGIDDLDDTIARLCAYRDAGAEVVYAPALVDLGQIAAVVDAVGVPVNCLLVPRGPSVAELATAGVRRVSLGSFLANLTNAAVIAAATRLQAEGTIEAPSLDRALVRRAFTD
jgi:2-methylisocitrate lyase-like PEP mutase family enzyme